MYRDCRRNKAIGDVVWVAFTVVGIEKPDRLDLKPHLLRRLARMPVATITILDAMDAQG